MSLSQEPPTTVTIAVTEDAISHRKVNMHALPRASANLYQKWRWDNLIEPGISDINDLLHSQKTLWLKNVFSYSEVRVCSIERQSNRP